MSVKIETEIYWPKYLEFKDFFKGVANLYREARTLAHLYQQDTITVFRCFPFYRCGCCSANVALTAISAHPPNHT